jgi:lipopolysaccharide export system protein LptC
MSLIPPNLASRRGSPPSPRRFTQSYSRFVSMMKFTLPVVALALVSLVALWPHLAPDDLRFRIGFAAIKASITKDPSMLNPRFVGTDTYNKPYSVTADLARSIGELGAIIELEMPKADVTLDNGTWLVLTANSGLFAHLENTLSLEGMVNLFHDSGYEFQTEKAAINMASGVASGNMPIQGQGDFGLLSAQGFKLVDKGKTIYFMGKSKLTLHPGARKLKK